jgi:hypothetical protein
MDGELLTTTTEYPRAYIIYRTSAALEFIPGKDCLFLKFAKALPGVKGRPKKGQRRYNWDEFIIFALNIHEMNFIALLARRILAGREVNESLYHEKAGVARVLRLQSGGEGAKAPAFLSLSFEGERIVVALSGPDLFFMSSVFPQLSARLLNWPL